MKRSSLLVTTLLLAICSPTRAVVTDFFNSSQSYSLFQSGATFDTISSEGYLFTYTRDKLFTGGLGGGPIGRPVMIDWPAGLEAQAVTTGPTTGPATFTIKRVDGSVFDLPAFTAKLFGNTAATGAAIEIMPLLNGQDGFADPLTFDVTGYAGSSFTYNTTTPLFLGNTSTLRGFDTYNMTLFVDFGLTDVQLNGLVVPEPGTATLVIAGAALLGFSRRRRPSPWHRQEAEA